MKRFGIYANFGYSIRMAQRAKLIRQAGFEATSIWWEAFEEFDVGLQQQVEQIREQGIFLENAHASYMGINAIWQDGLDGEEILGKHLKWLEELSRFQIPIMVMHPNVGFKQIPPPSPVGLKRFCKIMEKAEDCGVLVACENSYENRHLHYLFQHISSPALKFCYDSSHDFLCSKEKYRLLEQYKDKLVCLHLSDCDGRTDSHWMLGEGRINWPEVRRKLKNFSGTYMLEVMSEEKDRPEVFLQRNMAAAKKILEKD